MIHSIAKKVSSRAASVCLLAGAITFPVHCMALQPIEVVDGATVFAKVSKKEVTRLAVDGNRIASIRVKKGEIFVEQDDETGQVFLTLPPKADKPINGFLTTEAGQTFTLVLQPEEIQADSIILRVPRAFSPNPVASSLKSNSYDKALKQIIFAMANEDGSEDLEVREVNRVVPLWKETNFVLERQFNSDRFVGEKYVLTNVSSAPIVLDEREFYRAGVSVVSIEQLQVVPGGFTRVFIIRERSGNE